MLFLNFYRKNTLTEVV